MQQLDKLPPNLYQLVTWPDERLKMVSEVCTKEDVSELKKMVKPMQKIMEAFNGVGLAAVQIGVLKRFCLLQTGTPDPYNPNAIQIVEMINPEIIETEGDKEAKNEGCLSLPRFNESIDRYNEITVKYRDMDWNERTAVFMGLEAQCVQHEIDHMDGITQNQKVSLTKQQMWEKKLKKGRKHGRIRV